MIYQHIYTRTWMEAGVQIKSPGTFTAAISEKLSDEVRKVMPVIRANCGYPEIDGIKKHVRDDRSILRIFNPSKDVTVVSRDFRALDEITTSGGTDVRFTHCYILTRESREDFFENPSAALDSGKFMPYKTFAGEVNKEPNKHARIDETYTREFLKAPAIPLEPDFSVFRRLGFSRDLFGAFISDVINAVTGDGTVAVLIPEEGHITNAEDITIAVMALLPPVLRKKLNVVTCWETLMNSGSAGMYNLYFPIASGAGGSQYKTLRGEGIRVTDMCSGRPSSDECSEYSDFLWDNLDNYTAIHDFLDFLPKLIQKGSISRPDALDNCLLVYRNTELGECGNAGRGIAVQKLIKLFSGHINHFPLARKIICDYFTSGLSPRGQSREYLDFYEHLDKDTYDGLLTLFERERITDEDNFAVKLTNSIAMGFLADVMDAAALERLFDIMEKKDANNFKMDYFAKLISGNLNPETLADTGNDIRLKFLTDLASRSIDSSEPYFNEIKSKIDRVGIIILDNNNWSKLATILPYYEQLLVGAENSRTHKTGDALVVIMRAFMCSDSGCAEKAGEILDSYTKRILKGGGKYANVFFEHCKTALIDGLNQNHAPLMRYVYRLYGLSGDNALVKRILSFYSDNAEQLYNMPGAGDAFMLEQIEEFERMAAGAGLNNQVVLERFLFLEKCSQQELPEWLVGIPYTRISKVLGFIERTVHADEKNIKSFQTIPYGYWSGMPENRRDDFLKNCVMNSQLASAYCAAIVNGLEKDGSMDYQKILDALENTENAPQRILKVAGMIHKPNICYDFYGRYQAVLQNHIGKKGINFLKRNSWRYAESWDAYEAAGHPGFLEGGCRAKYGVMSLAFKNLENLSYSELAGNIDRVELWEYLLSDKAKELGFGELSEYLRIIEKADRSACANRYKEISNAGQEMSLKLAQRYKRRLQDLDTHDDPVMIAVAAIITENKANGYYPAFMSEQLIKINEEYGIYDSGSGFPAGYNNLGMFLHTANKIVKDEPFEEEVNVAVAEACKAEIVRLLRENLKENLNIGIYELLKTEIDELAKLDLGNEIYSMLSQVNADSELSKIYYKYKREEQPEQPGQSPYMEKTINQLNQLKAPHQDSDVRESQNELMRQHTKKEHERAMQSFNKSEPRRVFVCAEAACVLVALPAMCVIIVKILPALGGRADDLAAMKIFLFALGLLILTIIAFIFSYRRKRRDSQ